METHEMILLVLALGLFVNVTLAETIEEINRNISEFRNKLILIATHPIFIISIIILCFVGLVFLIIHKYNLHLERKRMRLEEIEKERLRNLRAKQKAIVKQKPQEPKIVEPTYLNTFEKKLGRNVTIRVDKDKRYFHKKRLNRDEVDYLLRKNYEIKKYKNLLNDKMEDFLLLPRHNEGLMHHFMVYNISEFLEKNGIETELYVTKKPDIVFKIGGKRFAIEIETGTIFSKIERMKEKLKVLENYDKWFFVVTDRNKVKKYKKFGDAIDKRYVKQRLEKLLKIAKKA